MKKLVIFHICALPQLLKVGPPLEKNSGSAPELAHSQMSITMHRCTNGMCNLNAHVNLNAINAFDVLFLGGFIEVKNLP